MNTTNLISTPNIEGNIGSCSVQIANSKIDNSFFTARMETIQTNSCTGEIIGRHEYTTYGGIWIIVLFSIFCLILMLGISADHY